MRKGSAVRMSRPNRVQKRLAPTRQALPSLPLEDRALGDSGGHELRPLIEDPAGADRIVTDLGVTHVRIVRQTDRCTVGAQRPPRVTLSKVVQDRCVGKSDGVTLVAPPDPDTVHDDED